MKEETLASLEAVLRHFAIKPRYFERHGRVFKIFSDKGIFALKRISAYSGTGFIRHLQFLFQRGYHRIVPVYPTVDGRYGVLDHHYLYYLMPWLPNKIKEERSRRQQQMFRELARLHGLSVRKVFIKTEDKAAYYEKTVHEWEKDEEFLEGFMEQCENRVYMSPFELLFCLYYIDVFRAQQYAKEKFHRWFKQTGEKEDARIVLVHGNISPEHFVYDDKGYGYFINFEKSRPGSPLMDLLPFLSRVLRTFPQQCDECVDWINVYFKHFPLTEEEMLLFQSYFSRPWPIIRTVAAYFQTGEPDERRFVEELQRNYWLLKNTEYVVMRLEEMERRRKEQEALDEHLADNK